MSKPDFTKCGYPFVRERAREALTAKQPNTVSISRSVITDFMKKTKNLDNLSRSGMNYGQQAAYLKEICRNMRAAISKAEQALEERTTQQEKS